jgi:uncharacterized protein with HEPN domain
MYSKLLVLHTLELISESLEQISERCTDIHRADDFINSKEGVLLFDSICMKLTAIGESVKTLDKITGRQLLIQYPEIEWRNVMGVRDIIVHHYFDVDTDEIYRICKEDVPTLHAVINNMIQDLANGSI